MPIKDHSLHDNVPDNAAIALLIIDMINDLEFEGGEAVYPYAQSVARHIANLKRRCKQIGIPVIYVNDNFGKWQSDFNKFVVHCLEDHVRGQSIVALLKPDEDDYFVLKPKQSGFFHTTLDLLLQYLKAHTLILTGMAGNICVMFTANDAYMRDFRLIVPADCMASANVDVNTSALQHMHEVLGADITPSTQLDFGRLSDQMARFQEGVSHGSV
jgi:nicotinamidase-related amidase